MDQITYKDFSRLEIKIGTILSAEAVEKSTKLLKLMVDINEDSPRQIITGLAPSITDPNELVGTQVPVLINLAPKLIMGLESQGMLLAASNSEGVPVLICPADFVNAGSTVK